MNRAEYVLVLGLLLGILSKVSAGKAAFFFGLLCVVAVAYALLVEAINVWRNRQAAKNPPFALQTQLFFPTNDERNEFADRMKTLIQDMRREKDPKNGLTEAQLDGMAAEQQSDTPSEEAQRYYGPAESAQAEAPVEESVPNTEDAPIDEEIQSNGSHDDTEPSVKKPRKVQAKKGAAQKEVKRRYKTDKQSIEQIAAEMGYTDLSTVYRYLKDAGIKLRPKAKK